MISQARRTIVFRSIRSALLKGQEIEYWLIRMYEQLDSGALTSSQVAELEEIALRYFDEQDEAEPEPEPMPEELEGAEE